MSLQGLDWYKARLKQDSDGDVADEFLEESSLHLRGTGLLDKSHLKVQPIFSLYYAVSSGEEPMNLMPRPALQAVRPISGKHCRQHLSGH